MDRDLKILGNIIKKGRKEKRVTQKVFAENVFLSESYVKDLERGRANPGLPSLLLIVDYLKIDITPYLYPDRGDKTLYENLIQLEKSCTDNELNVLYATATALIEQRSESEQRKRPKSKAKAKTDEQPHT